MANEEIRLKKIEPFNSHTHNHEKLKIFHQLLYLEICEPFLQDKKKKNESNQQTVTNIRNYA